MKLDPLIVSRNKLYTILSIGFGMGYGWLVYQLHAAMSHSHGPTLCLIKNVTGIPCPSCGITRAVMAIIHGDMNGAFYSNPLGFFGGSGIGGWSGLVVNGPIAEERFTVDKLSAV